MNISPFHTSYFIFYVYLVLVDVTSGRVARVLDAKADAVVDDVGYVSYGKLVTSIDRVRLNTSL